MEIIIRIFFRIFKFIIYILISSCENTTDVSLDVMSCTGNVFWIKTGGDHDLFIMIFIFVMQEMK